jgi:hypothetical protein
MGIAEFGQRAGGEGAFMGGLVQEAVPGTGRVRRVHGARQAQKAPLALLAHAQAQEVAAQRRAVTIAVASATDEPCPTDELTSRVTGHCGLRWGPLCGRSRVQPYWGGRLVRTVRTACGRLVRTVRTACGTLTKKRTVRLSCGYAVTVVLPCAARHRVCPAIPQSRDVFP